MDRAVAAPPPETARGGADNPFVALVFNIVVPALVLSKMSTPERLGPQFAMLVAISFPLAYAVYDFVRRRKANVIAILGFVNVLATGSFGLMEVPGKWFAIKEAALPLLIGTAIVASLRSKNPLVKAMLYNDRVIDVPRVDAELAARNAGADFQRLLVRATWMLAASFLISAVLNTILSLYLLEGRTGTPEFNQELGHLTAISYGVVVVPCTLVTMGALWMLLSGIKKLTGLDLDTIFKNQPQKAGKTGPEKAP
jgi:hypothetical protein